MSLKTELSEFWKWASISFEDYSSSAIPSFARQPEWEGEYPGWSKLEKEAVLLITALNKQEEYDRDDLRNILTALAIDNESELLKDSIIEVVTNYSLVQALIQESYSFELFHARWLMVEIIKEAEIDNKRFCLESFIKQDPHKYVQRRLMALVDVDEDLAKQYAKVKISDDDEYMRLVSLEILQNTEDYDVYRNLLKNDPSPLIQRRLNL